MYMGYVVGEKKKLEVVKLNKAFDKKLVLSDINFDVKEHEFFSILGSSGCGKTTLLRILIGLEKPLSGSIFKDGENITNLHPSKRGMGIVFQNYALFENMTAYKNIEYVLHSKRVASREAKDIALSLLSMVGLENHRDKYPSELSGGQQQRLAIVRTLALTPDVILFDEPMSALDIATRLELRKEIKNLQTKFGTTIIYVTHDQEEAFAMSDRIMVMSNSKIRQIGAPLELVRHPADEFVDDFVNKNLRQKVESLRPFVE